MNTINMWSNETDEYSYGANAIKSETQPSAYHYAVVNFKRVKGATYRPYTAGSAEWNKKANQALSDHARHNFEIGKR